MRPDCAPKILLETALLCSLACPQSRTQSNACARARMALALGKLTTGTPKFSGSGSLSACTIDISIVHADKEPEPLNLGVPVVNFPRANAILARAQALLWVRDWLAHGVDIHSEWYHKHHIHLSITCYDMRYVTVNHKNFILSQLAYNFFRKSISLFAYKNFNHFL